MSKFMVKEMESKIFDETLKELKQQFPGKTLLSINDTARAYGFEKENGEPNPQSIYNALRKNAVNPFPVKPVKRCGKLFFNIVHIAMDMAS